MVGYPPREGTRPTNGEIPLGIVNRYPNRNAPTPTPEALKPIAPGWRGSAYPGLGWLE
jgi:hypothetical protein